MYRRFIATITAASIAVTAIGALPAAADDRDTARALAAILGIAVVGKIIHDSNERREIRHERGADVYQPKKTHKKQVHKNHVQKNRNQSPRYEQGHVQPRPLPQRVSRNLLPGQCLHSFRGANGKIRMFGRKCLRNNYRFVNDLPRRCLHVFDTPRGDRRGYEARCMRRQGYRLAHG